MSIRTGRIEIRADGAALPCTPMTGSRRFIDHKRLGHVLQIAQLIQADRDNRRASGSASRTNQRQAPRLKERKAGTRKQRKTTVEDLNTAIGRTMASLQDPLLKTS
ncbi:hypothetical protein CIC12_32130 [Burkholderia sp. SG-MS1]|uniref:hypothetical protein n=1 Tax=Paraburkholderia sp. SG-MS1 TaxID=2023741 RepID=UPI001447C2D4|nr:hypothetical protein [Paraburkholderia sp. SG-MS1]NKJ51287.1 hypothetical protein [Paraburkholderia sp. SG-MS1]